MTLENLENFPDRSWRQQYKEVGILSREGEMVDVFEIEDHGKSGVVRQAKRPDRNREVQRELVILEKLNGEPGFPALWDYGAQTDGMQKLYWIAEEKLDGIALSPRQLDELPIKKKIQMIGMYLVRLRTAWQKGVLLHDYKTTNILFDEKKHNVNCPDLNVCRVIPKKREQTAEDNLYLLVESVRDRLSQVELPFTQEETTHLVSAYFHILHCASRLGSDFVPQNYKKGGDAWQAIRKEGRNPQEYLNSALNELSKALGDTDEAGKPFEDSTEFSERQTVKRVKSLLSDIHKEPDKKRLKQAVEEFVAIIGVPVANRDIDRQTAYAQIAKRYINPLIVSLQPTIKSLIEFINTNTPIAEKFGVYPALTFLENLIKANGLSDRNDLLAYQQALSILTNRAGELRTWREEKDSLHKKRIEDLKLFDLTNFINDTILEMFSVRQYMREDSFRTVDFKQLRADLRKKGFLKLSTIIPYLTAAQEGRYTAEELAQKLQELLLEQKNEWGSK